GRRKLIGTLTAEDLDYMVENRTINHAKAGSALAMFTENVGIVSPTVTEHGTLGDALDAGEFRSSSVNERDNERASNLPGTDRTPTPRKPGPPIVPERMGWFYRGKTNA